MLKHRRRRKSMGGFGMFSYPRIGGKTLLDSPLFKPKPVKFGGLFGSSPKMGKSPLDSPMMLGGGMNIFGSQAHTRRTRRKRVKQRRTRAIRRRKEETIIIYRKRKKKEEEKEAPKKKTDYGAILRGGYTKAKEGVSVASHKLTEYNRSREESDRKSRIKREVNSMPDKESEIL